MHINFGKTYYRDLNKVRDFVSLPNIEFDKISLILISNILEKFDIEF